MNDIEILINYIENHANNFLGSRSTLKDVEVFEYMYDLLIKTLEKQLNNGWIPVSERLPDDKKVVLQVTIKRLKDDYTWVQSLLWDYDKWKWWEEDDKEVDASRFKILAWQPLPEPYKEDNQCKKTI